MIAVRFQSELVSDIGRKRSQNQDRAASEPSLGLFVVADGMGGHQGGEIASSIAVEVIVDFVRNHRGKDPRETINQAVLAANEAIYTRSAEETSLHGMGTTATALLFDNDKMTIGHVGDSRCYFIRPDAMWQVTKDHSLVEERMRAGIITREQAKNDELKNVITRSVGFDPDLEVDLFEQPVQPGDLFLICSDGLSGPVEDAQILEIVRRKFFQGGHLNETVAELVRLANEKGGDDNITVVMVQVLA